MGASRGKTLLIVDPVRGNELHSYPVRQAPRDSFNYPVLPFIDGFRLH